MKNIITIPIQYSCGTLQFRIQDFLYVISHFSFYYLQFLIRKYLEKCCQQKQLFSLNYFIILLLHINLHKMPSICATCFKAFKPVQCEFASEGMCKFIPLNIYTSTC